jgi:hypothetical protein
MEQSETQLLSRAGNYAVVHLPGRAFPGIHVQGDTFAALRMQLVGAARTLRREPTDLDALDELDVAVEEMGVILGFYEQVLSERGIRRPY